MSTVVLKIEGVNYAGWLSVSIIQDLQSIAHSFKLSLASRDLIKDKITEGSRCEIVINDVPVISGYIDNVVMSYDSKQYKVDIDGRSKTADLVDCSIPPKEISGGQFNNQTFIQLCQVLASKFGINVVDKVGDWQPLKRVVMEQGQPVFEFIETIARSQAVLLQSNSDGDLVITRAANQQISTALVLGKNILSAMAKRDMDKRFSHYYFTGQSWGDDNQSGAQSAHINDYENDDSIRYRPTVLQAEDVTNIQQIKARAIWQRNLDYGRSKPVVYKVNGWHHKDGLWAINNEVKVIDNWLDIDDWMLITRVAFSLDSNGELTEITVMPKVAFDVLKITASTGGW